MNRFAAIALTCALLLACGTLFLTVEADSTDERPLDAVADVVERGSTIPTVRVLIGGAARQEIRIAVEGPYRITAEGDWRVLAQGARLRPVIARLDDDDEIHVGEKSWRVDAIDVETLEDATLWVGDRKYRGNLRIAAGPSGTVQAINLVELPDYVASVVNSEMPAEFPLAARRAQAIAARTFAVYQMKTFGAQSAYDINDGVSSQAYHGVLFRDEEGRQWAVEDASSRNVERTTRGVVLGYRGRVFCSFYTAVCGGETARGTDVFEHAAPPLVGVACDFCRDAKNYRWRRHVEAAPFFQTISQELRRRGAATHQIAGIEIDQPHDQNWPDDVTLVGDVSTVRVGTRQLRRDAAAIVALPSDTFRMQQQADSLVIEGRGWGHRVGLCQWGARRQAIEGFDCDSILAYYYPGSELLLIQ